MSKAAFGSSQRLISDRGAVFFTSEDFQHFFEEREIHHILINTAMPCSNGQVERLNSTIINDLL